MRIESDKPVGQGKGWIHRMSEAVTVKAPPKKEREPRDVRKWTALADDCYFSPDANATRAQVAADLGVSIESLERLGVGCGFDDYRKFSYSTWPERRQGGKVMGIIRRYRVPVKDDKNKLMMEGGRHGLYLPRDWWRGTGPILIPEGGSDTAALTTLGISAIGRPSNVGGVNMLIGVLAKEHLTRPVIVIGEHDQKPDRIGTQSCKGESCDGCTWCFPGRYGARETAAQLALALPRLIKVDGKSKRVRILWSMAPDGFKDVRQWLNESERPTAEKLMRRLVPQ